jgi:hypothetical protein
MGRFDTDHGCFIEAPGGDYLIFFILMIRSTPVLELRTRLEGMH